MHSVMGTGRLIAGRYRLQGPIGRGAMGIVWRGRDELLARDVAVKEVQISAVAVPADAEAIYQRTLREARTAARLSHPSVVTVFDVVEENGSPWIVMELVEARSLDRVITEDGPLPPLEAAELGASLVSALTTAHAAGVLHRDVKPSNVLVTKDGRAVLTDFGIATFAEDPSMTQAGMVVGTPGFTAPERIRGDIATPASDLWSLGATLYAAVEGRGPFDRVGGSSVIIAGVANEDAPRAPSAGPLGPVIDALLSRDPGARPDATTATRLLADAATAARTGARPLGAGWLAAAADNSNDAPAGPALAPDGAGAAAPIETPEATPADRQAETSRPVPQAASFLDPPVFGELSMPTGTGHAAPPEAAAVSAKSAAEPAAAASRGSAGLDGGPILWQPIGSAAAPATAKDGDLAASPGGPGSGKGGSGKGGSGGSGPPASPAKRTSGRWRIMVAAIGIGAIVVAAYAGWDAYTHSQQAQALQNPPGVPLVSGRPVPTSPASGPQPGTRRPTPTAGTSGLTGGAPTTSPHGGKSPHGGSKPGKSPTSTPSVSPKGTASPTSSPTTSGSPSPSPTPTPTTPSPGPTPPVLPAGYIWHHFTASLMGSTAGFKIGMPVAWKQAIAVLVAHLNQPARNFHLAVGLGSWNYAKPLPQARYLYGLDAADYHGFRLLSLGAIGFRSVGGFKAAPAAELKFGWHKTSGASFTEMVVLVMLDTKSGPQPYTFTLWAPTSTFPAANGIFHAAMKTFRPLPGA
jgi:eukaryotic-like serine/threonine-protein kinase